MSSLNYFDLHCDTITACLKWQKELKRNDLHLDLDRGAGLDPWVQCFAVWIEDDCRGQEAIRFFEAAVETFYREIQKNADKIMAYRTAEDFQTAARQHKVAAILTVEGGAVLAGDLQRIPYLAEKGVKALTLTWNGRCEIGDGAGISGAQGLTDFGRDAVRELERCHIAIDLSHSSDALFYDTAKITQGPLMATHSNSRALCGHPRNLTDEMFTILCKRNGIAGLTFVPQFLRADRKGGISDLLHHIDHFLALGGENTLAIGSDFDGTDLTENIVGIESISCIIEAMLQHNYSEQLVSKILYQNARRFFTSL